MRNEILTVKELREMLKQYDENSIVNFGICSSYLGVSKDEEISIFEENGQVRINVCDIW